MESVGWKYILLISLSDEMVLALTRVEQLLTHCPTYMKRNSGPLYHESMTVSYYLVVQFINNLHFIFSAYGDLNLIASLSSPPY